MKLKLVGFNTKLKNRIEGYKFEVGVLDQKPRREVNENKEENKSTYAGGPVRKTTSTRSNLTNANVLLAVQEHLGIDILKTPFESGQNENIRKFANEFLKYIFGAGKEQRVINLLQAIVRNPILRGDYGFNKGITADIKGFDRLMIDTGQLFKSIKARIIK